MPADAALDDGVAVRGEIVVREFDAGTLRRAVPRWDDLDRDARERALYAVAPAPDRVTRSANTTVDGLHQLIVDLLDPGNGRTDVADHVAVGTDNTTPTSGDSALGNEVARNSAALVRDDGTSLFVSAFFDTTEANGNTLVEAGVFTAATGGTLLNHGLIASVSKDNTIALTVDITLSFTAA